MQLAYPILPVVSRPQLNMREVEAGLKFGAASPVRDLAAGGMLTFFYALETGLRRL
jgi:hypothetical protein